MTTTEFCMMLVMLFLTWHLWRMSKRIRELELHNKAQWETISRLWEEIRANRTRVANLEKSVGNDTEDVLLKKVEEAMRNSIMC